MKLQNILIFVFLFAIFLSYASPTFAHEETIIEMRSNAFVPNEIHIEQGKTVIFKNVDTTVHWPASNIHPTHTLYPEFDPLKGIEPGNSWSFKFNKVGNWRFHDHLNPVITGIIHVTGNGKNSEKPSISFQEKAHNFFDEVKFFALKRYYAFFPQKLQEMLSKKNFHTIAHDPKQLKYWLEIVGGEKYMAKLSQDSGNGSIFDCHQEAHAVGRMAYALFGGSVFQTGNYYCHSGYYHGAMETLLQQEGTEHLYLSIEKICNSFPTSFGKFECLHGIGHGVTAYVDYNLPQALTLCASLSNDFAKRSCYGGVFMENILTAQGKGAGSHKTTWVNSDPLFPCNGIDKIYAIQYECYQMQTSRMLDIGKYDFSFVVNNCAKAPESMKQVCFKSMGRDAAGQTLRNPQKILALCQTVPIKYFHDCIQGGLNVIIDFWGEKMADQPQELCNLLPISTDQSFCYDLLGNRLTDVFGNDKNKKIDICDFSEKQYVTLCKTAAKI